MHLMWWVEGSRLRCTTNPSSADSGEKASQAPFAVSLFAGINAECLLRALICCCRAGKQASWKGATRCLLRLRPGAGQGGDCWGARLRRGQLQGCGGDHSLSAGRQESAKDKRDTGFPITFPNHPPPHPVLCSENFDPRIPCSSFHGNSRPPSPHCLCLLPSCSFSLQPTPVPRARPPERVSAPLKQMANPAIQGGGAITDSKPHQDPNRKVTSSFLPWGPTFKDL